MLHSFTELSALPEAMNGSLPTLGTNSRQVTACVCPGPPATADKVARHLPVARSHTRRVESTEPDHSMAPVGAQIKIE